MEDRTLICEASREEEEGAEQGEEGGGSTENIQLSRPCSEPWSSRTTQTPHRRGVGPAAQPAVPDTTEEGSPSTSSTLEP